MTVKTGQFGEMQNMKEVTIVYDGECPLCRNYARLVKLDENVESVDLVDARQMSPIRQQLTDQGYDLDRGMAVQADNQLFFGADALTALACVSRRSDWFNRACYQLFRSRAISVLIYPSLRGVRNLVLWVMNIPKIKNLKKDDGNG